MMETTKQNITNKNKEEITVSKTTAEYIANLQEMNLVEIKKELRRLQSNKCNYKKEGKPELLSITIAKEVLAKARRAELDGQRSEAKSYVATISELNFEELEAMINVLATMVSRRQRTKGWDPEDTAFLEGRLKEARARKATLTDKAKPVMSTAELDEYIAVLERAIEVSDDRAEKKRYQVALKTLQTIKK